MDLFTANLANLHQASKLEVKNMSLGLSPVLYERPSPSGPQVPHPDLFASLSESKASDLPSSSQCAVHLELLEVFFALRTQIISSRELDETFGTEENKKTVYKRKYNYQTGQYVNEAFKLWDSTWDRRRESKWSSFLDIASGRFMVWSKRMEKELSTAQRLAGLSLNDKELTGVDLPHLPPLDVLMIWHAFLLNPGDFQSYCRGESLARLPRVTFPWQEVHNAIDSNYWGYLLPEKTISWLEKEAKLEPDLYTYLTATRNTRPEIVEVVSKSTGGLDLAKINALSTMEDQDTNFVTTLRIAATYQDQVNTLALNTKQQATFVEKMHNHLWIRSPAVAGTLRRAGERYNNFLELFRLYPGRMLVPTLDIDIVWHTHQLSAQAYASSMESRCGRFVDHNDKIRPRKLDVGMGKTEEVYAIRFGQPYSTCLCWDCEAITSELEEAENAGRLDEVEPDDLAVQVGKKVERFRKIEVSRRRGQVSPIYTRH